MNKSKNIEKLESDIINDNDNDFYYISKILKFLNAF